MLDRHRSGSWRDPEGSTRNYFSISTKKNSTKIAFEYVQYKQVQAGTSRYKYVKVVHAINLKYFYLLNALPFPPASYYCVTEVLLEPPIPSDPILIPSTTQLYLATASHPIEQNFKVGHLTY